MFKKGITSFEYLLKGQEKFLRSQFFIFLLITVFVLPNTGCGRIWSDVSYAGKTPFVTSPSSQSYRYFLYVCANDAAVPVMGFSMDPSTGELTAVPGPLPTAFNCFSTQLLTISPTDQLLFFDGGPIQGYKVDPSTGALSLAPNATFTPNNDGGFLVDTLMRFVFAQDLTDTSSLSYTVGANDSLAVGQGPYAFGGGGTNNSCIQTPDGNYIYCVDGYDQTFSGYTVNANGTLSNLPVTWPVACAATHTYDTALAIDPYSKYLYLSCSNSSNATTIFPYQINSGSLLARATVSTTCVNDTVAVDNTGSYLYIQETIAGNSGTKAYKILANGSLNLIGTYGIGVVNGANPVVDPSNAFVAVQGINLSLQTINGDGSLSYYSGAVSGGGGGNTVFDPTGNFVFVDNSFSNSFSGYKIDRSAGTVTPITGVAPLSINAPQQLLFVKMLSQ